MARVALPLPMLLVSAGLLMASLAACGASESGGACLDGSRRCAAASVQPGLRSVRRGYRIGRYHWLRRTNRESGVPDVGIEAEWLPIRE
jgi:hypothetical protein